jgi:predicted nucleic acid-binding protein
VKRETYSKRLARARTLIGRRDPDDIDTLALTLHMHLPLWSNDSDFENAAGIEWYTTAELLQRLGVR